MLEDIYMEERNMLTYATLNGYSKKQLMKLVEYYTPGKVTHENKKEEIIDYILEFLYNEPDEYELKEPEMSVRIKRIKESFK